MGGLTYFLAYKTNYNPLKVINRLNSLRVTKFKKNAYQNWRQYYWNNKKHSRN